MIIPKNPYTKEGRFMFKLYNTQFEISMNLSNYFKKIREFDTFEI